MESISIFQFVSTITESPEADEMDAKNCNCCLVDIVVRRKCLPLNLVWNALFVIPQLPQHINDFALLLDKHFTSR
jgi:hypothetical protein